MRVSRRTFGVSLACFSAWLARPTFASRDHATGGNIQAGVIPNGESDIAALEAYVQQHPDAFVWDIHNQLRHFYASRDPQRSMHHVDMILAHAIMDPYMLDILSEWQLEQDTVLARVHMFDVMERLPSFLYIRAACFIKTGDVSAAHKDAEAAIQLYQRAVALGNRHGATHSALKRYQTLAQYRLRMAQA